MPVPVITVGQMREWEAATWRSGISEAEVIQQVGCLVAERAMALTQPDDRILILAGKGHNGDDARAAVPHLVERRANVLEISDPAGQLGKVEKTLAEGAALIVDGLFGIGLNRPLGPEWINLINGINRAEAPVLAIDVPSGLNAETGLPEGAAIHASCTLTVGAPKTGLLRRSAMEFVGRLEVAPDIGLIPCPHQGDLWWTLPEDFRHFPPRRPLDGHKGTFGHVVIFAGSVGYHGAAVLAAGGALRAQPGLVTVVCPENVYAPVASQCRAAMVQPWDMEFRLPDSCTAILFGPGLAAPDIPKELRMTVGRLWENSPVPVVADASGLAWLQPGTKSAGSVRIITPHPGEAARLLETSAGEVQEDRKETLQKLSERFGDCLVVLKGHYTLVGRHGETVFVNPSGNPFLAQGGTGDVLAGYLAGFLAQPALARDPALTARFAVWRHGDTADRLTESKAGWTTEDLNVALGAR